MDFVFTVCGRAAQEACPIWPGQPMTAHWGIADPDREYASEDEEMRGFMKAYLELEPHQDFHLPAYQRPRQALPAEPAG